MADKTSSTVTVAMVAEFGDGSTQTISQNDPSMSNLVNKIKAFATFVTDESIFISEKSNATISRIKSAKIINRQTTTFDLGK